jgi:NADPH2 dehydrogenase
MTKTDGQTADNARNYRRIGTLKSVDEFRLYLNSAGVELSVDDTALATDSPLEQPLTVGNFRVGNRWCIHPMEGWDGTRDGQPSEHTRRRWRNFGASGAKLLWGGEAFAVQSDGRANPHQLFYRPENVESIRALYGQTLDTHRESFGANATDDLMIGLQLTHSGRFCRPNPDKKLRPRIAYHHPLLDHKFNIAPDDDSVVLTDDDLKRLVDSYVVSAKMAADIGFQFVDVKHCHGYLGHELLSAFTRPGPFGGDFFGRTKFLRDICDGIRTECPRLSIGVRLSLFDQLPFTPDPELSTGGIVGPGIPEVFAGNDYPGFGCQRDSPLTSDWAEPVQLLEMMRDELKIELVNLSAGSPYYNPHIQRPAFYPPSDGYQPPEDPVIGCVRQIEAVREMKRRVPDLPMVGTAYSYFQEFIPHVAQALVREDAVDFIGLGRVVLSHWTLPADVKAGRDLRAIRKVCRTFSDCTTAPRNGMISGCYPLDDYYKSMPEHAELKRIKREQIRPK